MASEIRQRRPISGNESPKDQTSKSSQDKSTAGFGRLFTYLVGLLVLSVIVLVAVTPAPIDPFVITEIPPPPHFNGTLEPNYELTRAERLFENQIRGPESIVVRNGEIYTGTADGRILRIDANQKIHELARIGVPPCGRLSNEPNCGRPLGMRFDVTGYLFVVDAYLGMYKVNLTTGEVHEVLSPNTVIEKHVPAFMNDLDLAADGNVYFSDSSKKWSRRDFPNIFLEGAYGGRMIRFNRKTGEVKEVVDELRFANGVQITHDKRMVLVADTGTCRILSLDLDGWKKDSYSVFSSNLPGFPDNIRLSSTGGYWVGFAGVRRADRFSPFDYTATRPWLRKWLSKIFDPMTLVNFLPKYGLIVELDHKGDIVRSLHDPTGKVIPSVSEVHDENGILYLGSYNQPYLGRLDIREANKEFLKKRAEQTAKGQ